jgi:NAD+ synthase
MNKISQWIKKYARGKTLVIGVSGGIDSAVTSTLCAETGLPVYAITMPIDSDEDSQILAEAHLKWLDGKYENVQVETIELTNAYWNVLQDLGRSHPHANANTKSRLRMVCLYYIATEQAGLVVGTGNKVEDFGVGFFTKYGDGGVDISPIANLYKSEVRELGRRLGISKDIINAVPTDGLWEDNRSDEDQLGVTYEELEAVMKGLPSSQKAKEVYNNFNMQNKHKMMPIPIYKGGIK